MRLIAGATGVEKDAVAVGNDARGEEVEMLEDAVAQALGKRAGDAFVAAAEDGDAPSAFLQLARQHFRHGRLTGSSNGEIADADNGTSDFLRAKNALSVEREARLHRAFIGEGEDTEHEFEGVGATTLAALEDDIDRVAFESLENDPHQLTTFTPALSAPRTSVRAAGRTDCMAEAT